MTVWDALLASIDGTIPVIYVAWEPVHNRCKIIFNEVMAPALEDEEWRKELEAAIHRVFTLAETPPDDQPKVRRFTLEDPQWFGASQ